MRVHEINQHIANGGKFFINMGNEVCECRFKSIIANSHNGCSVYTWDMNIELDVAGYGLTTTNGYKAHIYTDYAACAEDNEASPTMVRFHYGDGSIMDPYLPFKILADNGYKLYQGYYTKWCLGYVWDKTRVKEVAVMVSINLLDGKVTELTPNVYKTAEACKADHTINVRYFAD